MGSEREDRLNCTSRWSLASGLLYAINEQREKYVPRSEFICVDESVSRFYGLGGDWIDTGLLRYVVLDRKPAKGCEIRTAACGKIGMMIRLEIVKSSTESENLHLKMNSMFIGCHATIGQSITTIVRGGML